MRAGSPTGDAPSAEPAAFIAAVFAFLAKRHRLRSPFQVGGDARVLLGHATL